MKKILLSLSIFLVLFCSNAFATTYYVRDDGGTSAQCDGTHDAPLAGAVDSADAGTLPDCALSHPSWALGYYDGSSVSTAGVMAAGDTLIIDGVSHIGSGQAQYSIGFGMPNTSGCSYWWPYACDLKVAPAGVSTSLKTKIYGKTYDSGCTNPPQLWGNEGVWFVLPVGSNTDVRCMEITDHSGCMFREGLGGNIDNEGTQDPIRCVEGFNTGVSSGPYARDGIQFSQGATGSSLTDMNIHGLSYEGVKGVNLGNIDVINTVISGNPSADWEGDPGSCSSGSGGICDYTGTITFTHSRFGYSGCGERYKATPSGKASLTAHDCTSQDQGGYGDSFGINGQSGNWVITDSQCDHSVSDCFDFLYSHGSTSTIKMTRTRTEAVAGASLKTSNGFNYVENSFLSSNCTWWTKSDAVTGSQYSPGRSGTTCNHNSVCDPNENFQNCSDCIGFNFCRPASQATMSISIDTTIPSHTYVYNSTLVGTGDTLIGVGGSPTCASGSTVEYKNDIFYGGNDYNGGDQEAAYYADCGGGALPTVTENHNVCYNGKTDGSNCSAGTDSTSNPNLSGPINQTSATPYTGSSYWNSFKPTGASTNVVGLGDRTITLQYSSNDMYNYSRGSSWELGALQQTTCGQDTDFCNSNADCCNSNCNASGVCGGTSSCVPNGGSTAGGACCSGVSSGGICVSNVCGNGTIEGPEQCDTSNLNSQTCLTKGYTGGTLGCALDCLSFDVSSCTSSSGPKSNHSSYYGRMMTYGKTTLY